MRTFVGLLGGLFLVLGVLVLGGAAFVTLDTSYDVPDYTCITTPGSSTVNCTSFDTSAVGHQTFAIGAVVLGGSLLVGGCALLGGAAAGSRRKPQPPFQAQPVPSGGPPTYGS